MTQPIDHGDFKGGQSESGLSEIAQEWIVRLVSGQITEEEIHRLKVWLAEDPSHQRAFERERKVWQELSRLEGVSAALALEGDQSFKQPLAVRRRARWFALVGAGIAACLAVVVLYQDIRTFLLADYQTGVGLQRVVTLPDGGVVYLNTDTAIAVDYSEQERGIHLLRGEALFEVVSNPQRPFRVQAQKGMTQAVGTVFVVRAEDQQTRVTVVEGTVGIAAGTEAQAGQSVLVHRDQQTVYRPGETPQNVRTVDGASAKAWSKGMIVIDGQPFAHAMAELDRYRPGRILVLADLSRTKPVSGRFALQNVDDAIAALAQIQGLNVVHMTDYFVVIL
ncbi:MAG: FecR domain-containing protein [Nitrospira sp.]